MMQSIGFDFQKSNTDISEFVEQLPQKLRIEVNMFIHENRYKNVEFFRDKTKSFISWTCPLLKPQLFQEEQFIFLEGDQASSMHFLTKGECGFVLPSY